MYTYYSQKEQFGLEMSLVYEVLTHFESKIY